MPTVLLTLPDSLRADLKQPWGSVFEDAEALLAEAGSPLIAVGDVVTFHLEDAGRTPDVSFVDELTERSAVTAAVASVAADPDVTVENPPATLTVELLSALVEAMRRVHTAGRGDPTDDATVRILVDGEEDLAALPAIVAAPDGASVVYGQPGEGMVLVAVTPETRASATTFLRAMEGDVDRALALVAGGPDED